jgi:polar amino acid transport system substrate-binding protein
VQQTEDLPARSKKCQQAGEAEIRVDAYQNQTDATAAVISGKDDAMLADSPVVAYAAGQSRGQLELRGEIYDAAPYGFVLRQDQSELAEAIQRAVKRAHDRRHLPRNPPQVGRQRGRDHTVDHQPLT